MGAIKKYVTIAGKEYEQPDIQRMKRKQIKKFEEVAKRVEKNPAIGMSSTYDMLEVLMPEVPVEAMDDLEFGEVQEIIEKAGAWEDSAPSEALGES